MKKLAQCSHTKKGFSLSEKEENSEIIFANENYEVTASVIPIEKCVFTSKDKGKRCDFLFLFDAKKQAYSFLRKSKAYYVELKGIDLTEAYEQLLNSITITRNEIPLFDLNAVIVSTRAFVPKYDNTENYRNLKRLINKNPICEITPHTIIIN